MNFILVFCVFFGLQLFFRKEIYTGQKSHLITNGKLKWSKCCFTSIQIIVDMASVNWFLERGGGFVHWDSGQTVCSLACWRLLPLHSYFSVTFMNLNHFICCFAFLSALMCTGVPPSYTPICFFVSRFLAPVSISVFSSSNQSLSATWIFTHRDPTCHCFWIK